MRTISPLRYPGGKAGLANFVKALISKNGLIGCDYAEPYCGGAGVALDLLRLEIVDRVHLNDVDPAIHSFWRSVVKDSDAFCELVAKAKLNIRMWRKQRCILQSPSAHSTLQVGFAAFYLNRVNRSGILSAGPIGGIEQDGEWLMDARFNRADLIERLQAIAQFRDRICIYSIDAAKFLANAKKWGSRATLCYMDPPYVVQGKRLYRNFYTEADHARIASLAMNLAVPWIVSYDNVPLIRKLYASCRQMTYGIGYSANLRGTGSEVMVFSSTLSIPRCESPLDISDRAWRTAA